jgi:glycosyltransferase involved in cell wall biosynthesis
LKYPGIPQIDPLPDSIDRPFWSVMIPTYNPGGYLEEAIESVLLQDPGPQEMHIEVVDDCSTKIDVEGLIRRVAGDRIPVFRQPRRARICGNWNTCIERAKGRWVHILHQDDLILPGFYQKLREGIEREPIIGSAFCRHIFIDDEGHWTYIPKLLARRSGVIPDWLELCASEVLIQCPAVVVKREVYEAIGGYNTELIFTPDWEMWTRIAANYQVWYEPQPLACYRAHQSSETSRLVRTGADINDLIKCIDILRAYLPHSAADRITKTARETYALSAVRKARLMLKPGDLTTALAQIGGALRCRLSWRVVKAVIVFFAWMLAHSVVRASRKFASSCRQAGLKY